MNKFYGPFYEGENEIWHWRKDCPDFPSHPNPKMMVSSSFPDKIELCSTCQQLDKRDSEVKMN
jgi:hypothetical protein